MNTDKSKYLVGELAEYFGVSNDTLRLYDKKGICSPQKNEMNHYRTYSREDFILLEFVMRLKQMGMTLDEIKMMVTDCSVEKAEAIMSIEAKSWRTNQKTQISSKTWCRITEKASQSNRTFWTL